MTNTVSNTYGMAQPKPFKYKDVAVTTNPELIVGIEIETERCSLSAGTYSELFKRTLGIDVKADGSLRQVEGLAAYEFITKPTMLQHVVPILQKFFTDGRFTEANYTDRCSIHVHANCTDMTWEQVANVSLIYTVVEEILFEFVNQRPGNRDGWSRDTNIYCVPWNQCRNHLNLVNQFIHSPSDALARWQKYTALNLVPLSTFGTMEFRHMHGTADMDKLTKWLNIIGAIFKHAKSIDLESLSADINGLNTSSHYEQFFQTVTGGQLPYNDIYRMKMEEGTILAKYSMMSWRNQGKKTAQEAPVFAPTQAVPQEAPAPGPATIAREQSMHRALVDQQQQEVNLRLHGAMDRLAQNAAPDIGRMPRPAPGQRPLRPTLTQRVQLERAQVNPYDAWPMPAAPIDEDEEF